MARPPLAVLILALDTTTRAGSTAVLRDETVLAVLEGDASRTHGERLPIELATALDLADVRARDIDLLAVASGPGAFTGLRIGLAAMQGLAMTLERPVVGVSALDALAAAITVSPQTGRVAAWMDAARGEVFAALVDVTAGENGSSLITEVHPASVGTPMEILAAWGSDLRTDTRFTGDGATRFRASLPAGAQVVEPPLLAATIARLGRDRAARGLAGPPHALQPLYVRRPDAEISRAAARTTP